METVTGFFLVSARDGAREEKKKSPSLPPARPAHRLSFSIEDRADRMERAPGANSGDQLEIEIAVSSGPLAGPNSVQPTRHKR